MASSNRWLSAIVFGLTVVAFQNCGDSLVMTDLSSQQLTDSSLSGATPTAPSPTITPTPSPTPVPKLLNQWTIGSSVGAPSNRVFNTSVWSGTEMIIWGGLVNFLPVNTGARYNPSLDTWTPISITGAPTSRVHHGAAFAAGKMIVFGGCGSPCSGSSGLGSGGIYDPGTNTWTVMSAVGAPSPRLKVFMESTGQEVVVWGGAGTDGLKSDGAIFNPTTNTWRPMSSFNAPSARNTSEGDGDHLVYADGKLFLYGGNVGFEDVTAGGGIYDLATDTWTLMPAVNSPSPREAPLVGKVGNSIYVLLGEGRSDGFRLDLASMVWTELTMTNPPQIREGLDYVFTGREFVALNVGQSIFDPVTGNWTAVSQVNAPTSGIRAGNATAVLAGSSVIYWAQGSPYILR